MTTVSSRLAYNPFALAIRFLLKMASLTAVGFWAWHAAPDAFRWLAALALPVTVAIAWGVLAVPGDRSRSGQAPVATPGPVRLLLELLVFFGSAAALAASGKHAIALVYVVVLVLYRITAFARIRWLLSTR